MATAVGSLYVNLGLNAGQFDAGLRNATARLQGFGQSFARIGARISTVSTALGSLGGVFAGLGAADAGSAIAGFAARMADLGEKAQNTAFVLGTSAKEVAQLGLMMEMAGGSSEDAEAAIVKLGMAVQDALVDKNGQAAVAFANIGISIAEVKRHANDVPGLMRLIADRVSQLEPGLQRTGALTDLAGRGFARLARMISGGAQGWDDARAAAEDYAATFERVLPQMNTLDGAIDKLTTNLKTLGLEGFAFIEPIVTGVVWALDKAVESITNMIRTVSAFLRMVDSALGWVERKIGLPDFSIGGNAENVPTLPETVVIGKPVGTRKAGGGGSGGADRAAREAERARRDAMQEKLAALSGEQSVEDAAFDRKRQRIRNEVELEKKTAAEGVEAQRKLLDEKWALDLSYYERKFAAAAGDVEQQRRLNEQIRADYERFMTDREGIGFDAARIGFNRLRDAAEELGSVLKDSFRDVFDSILDGTFKIGDALSSLARKLGSLLIDKAFGALFNSKSSGGLDLFGKLLGSVGIPGFATGGSFEVGGSGGIDSSLVAFRATPGEMVNVSKGGRPMGGAELVRIELNPSEGWVAGVADQRVMLRSGQIVEVAVRQSQKTMQRNLDGMMTQTQARRM